MGKLHNMDKAQGVNWEMKSLPTLLVFTFTITAIKSIGYNFQCY